MLDKKITKLIEESVKARLELREALASLSATIDEARDRFEEIRNVDEEARKHLNQKKETLP